MYVIRYAHPEARVADCLLYYGVVDAVREIATNRFSYCLQEESVESEKEPVAGTAESCL